MYANNHEAQRNGQYPLTNGFCKWYIYRFVAKNLVLSRLYRKSVVTAEARQICSMMISIALVSEILLLLSKNVYYCSTIDLQEAWLFQQVTKVD